MLKALNTLGVSVLATVAGAAAAAGAVYASKNTQAGRKITERCDALVLQARTRASAWLSSAAVKLAVPKAEHVIKVRRVMRVNGAAGARP